MSTKQSNLAVLAPNEVEVKIGDRTYTQKPLSLRATAMLITVLAGEIQTLVANPAAQALLATDAAKISVEEALPAMVQILASVPDLLARIVTVLLTGKLDDAEIAYIDEYTRLTTAMRIARTFVEQNEPEELVENFSVLRRLVTDAAAKAKAKAA